MISIFVSHSWNEHHIYEEFVTILDNELGSNSWTNLSIPRSQALNLSDSNYEDEELDRLEDELVQVQAALSRQGVPDALIRIVWDANGNRREEETIGSLREKEERLRNRISCLGDLLPTEYVRPPEFNNRKDSAESIRLHPALSLAIRRRINKADLVFILVTPFCRFRRWVNYELAVCAGTSAVVVAVSASGAVSHDFYLDCHKVIPWDSDAVRLTILESVASQTILGDEAGIRDRLHEALDHPSYRWRTIRRLAIGANVTEGAVERLLRADGNVRFGKNATGEIIAGLISRVGPGQ